MVGVVNESHQASCLVGVLSTLLIFTTVGFYFYPCLVLSDLEVDSSGHVVEEQPAWVTHLSIYQLPAALVGGFLLALPLWLCNVVSDTWLSYFGRLTVGVVLSSVYGALITYSALEFYTSLPFHAALGFMNVLNACALLSSYIVLFIRKLMWPKEELFRIRKYKDLVRQLLKHPPRQLYSFEAEVPIDDVLDPTRQSVYKVAGTVSKKKGHRIFDVFFPQRLLSSTFVTAYVTLTFSFVTVGNLLQFQRHYVSLLWQSLFKDEDLGLLAIIREIIGYACYTAFVPFAVVLVPQYFLLFYHYRQKLLKVRKGQYDFDVTLVDLGSFSFMGYQIFLNLVTLVVGVLVMVVLVGVGVACYFSDTARMYVIDHVIVIVTTFISGWILQKIWTWCFMDNGRLKRPALFFFVDFLNSAFFYIAGVTNAIQRALNALRTIALNFSRMDVSLYEDDAAYLAFLSVLVTDHHYNNPIVHVFMLLLLEKVKPKVTVAHATIRTPLLRDAARFSIAEHDDDGNNNDDGNDDDGNDDDKPPPSALSAATRLSPRSVLIRNRWQLAKFLIQNPSLIPFRKRHVASGDNPASKLCLPFY